MFLQGMVLRLLRMRMEAGIAHVGMPGAEEEEEAVITVVVEGVGTMALRWMQGAGIMVVLRLMTSKMQEATIKKHLFRAEVLIHIFIYFLLFLSILFRIIPLFVLRINSL